MQKPEEADKQSTEKPSSWKWLTTRFSKLQIIIIATVLCLLVVIIIALLITYAGPDKSVVDLELIDSSDSVMVSSGQDVQWKVKSNLPHSVSFEWINPGGFTLLPNPQIVKDYQVWTNGNKTVLRLYNVTHKHSGEYILRAYNFDAKYDEILQVELTVLNNTLPAHGKVVACYVAAWASKRHGLGVFNVDKIDPTVCTHLIYAFAVMNDSSNTIHSAYPEYDLEGIGNEGSYKKMVALKDKHPNLKVMLAVGGWDEGALKYSKMAASPTSRKAFINSVSEYLREYNFDGLEFHWLYPVISWRNGGVAQFRDRKNLVTLLKELREEFDKYGLLLTTPLGMAMEVLESSYDIPGISKHVHYLFAMCYSYHGHWEDKTGPNAALYPLYPGDTSNVESGINFLQSKGVPLEKLVLGVPLYGRLFLLANNDTDDIGFGVPARKDQSLPSLYVGDPGYWGYFEICKELDDFNSDWNIVPDETTRTPYAYELRKHQFLSYDDPKSIAYKVKFAMESNLAGIMAWSIDTDDFRGSCLGHKDTKFPLMKVINKAIWKATREHELHKVNEFLDLQPI